MNKIFLTMTLAFCTMIASAQYSVLTTVTSIQDEAGETTYNITDKLGVGYQVNEKLMVGLTMDGEDKYELLGRYLVTSGIWTICVYNYDTDYKADIIDKLDLGLGYSIKVWNNLYVDPSYTVSLGDHRNEGGETVGVLNMSLSYKF